MNKPVLVYIQKRLGYPREPHSVHKNKHRNKEE